ncbi:MAG: hypothetical protein JWO36_2702 [Myxococcales bacterium]|nr:hypothetical protein [Myxococcales bacterium]
MAASLIERVATRHEVDTSQLTASVARAEQFLGELRTMLQARFPYDQAPGFDVIVTGSLAKRQCTKGSDLDFFGVTEQPVESTKTEPIVRAMLEMASANGFDLPFSGGPNAAFVPRASIETIDLPNDTNRNVFRRMSLVTASVSVYRPELRADILRSTLSTFIGREREPRVRGIIDQILLLSRLGNMTVEWRMKDRTSSDGGLTQWSKSLTLYRIELAGAVAAVLRAGIASEGRSRDDLLDSVATELERAPLDRLLAWYDDVSPAGQQALAAVVGVANDTLCLLATDGVRTRLAAVADDEPTRALRQQFSEQMSVLRKALVQLFYRESVFRPWIEELGLFG